MKIEKILSFFPMVALVFLLMVSCSKSDSDLQNQITSNDLNSVKLTGNGAPSGTHFNLNIIGVKNEKEMSLEVNSGHVIFVPLQGRTKILLAEGEYAVLDKNATDGEGAFQLPNPDP